MGGGKQEYEGEREHMTSTKNRLRPAVSQDDQTVHGSDVSPLSQHNLRPPAEQHPFHLITHSPKTA